MKYVVAGSCCRMLRPTLALLLCVAGAPLRAQQLPTPLPGRVLTPAGAPVEYATVVLHRATDSVAVKTEFSDAGGQFVLVSPAPGRYLVSVLHLGYARAWAGPLEVGATAGSPLIIRLQPSTAQQLRGVTVTGRKPPFERLPDRTLVNVENSPLSAGSTVLEVLSRAPGVTVDGNDNVALRGRQGVLVLVDGRRQAMTGPELASYLRALPAEQVKNIELITNPPAKYDAQGTAGVIAINLRKDQRLGTNGSVNASYGRGRYGKLTSGLSLNHRSAKLNVYGSYAYSDRRGFQNLRFDRVYTSADGRLILRSEQLNERRVDVASHSGKAGLDYTLGARTTLGAMLSGLASRLPVDGRNTSAFYDATGATTLRYTAHNRSVVHTPNVAANLTFRHQFRPDSAGTAELTADADMARYGIERNLTLAATYLVPTRSPRQFSSDQDGTLTIQSAKVDFVRPLPRGLRLEAGAKASHVRSDHSMLLYSTVDGVISPDPVLSNGFRYREAIQAGYVSVHRSRPGLALTAGLRAEHTRATGQQTNGLDAFDRRYLQLFPNLSGQRTFSENHELGFSLSRRLDRPTYSQLNPLRFYIDPATYRAGNPYLQPQTSYNAELTHTYHKLTTGLSYSYTAHPILSVYELDAANLVRSTDANLTAQHYYAVTLAAPVAVAKWWQLHADAELFYASFRGTFAGSATQPGRVGAILNTNSTFALGQTWSAELSGSYHSREQYGFQVVRSFGQLTVGVQKTVWAGRGTLRLSGADLLYTAPVRATSRYVVLTETQRMSQDTRVGTVSLSYRFGGSEVAPARKRSTSAEDEKRRAAGQ